MLLLLKRCPIRKKKKKQLYLKCLFISILKEVKFYQENVCFEWNGVIEITVLTFFSQWKLLIKLLINFKIEDRAHEVFQIIFQEMFLLDLPLNDYG